jgi:hypothetical protein
VLIVTILLFYFIQILWSNGQKIAQYVLPAAWLLNLCPEIVAISPRVLLSGGLNLYQDGFM